MSTSNALQRLIEALNQSDLATIRSLLAPTFLDHDVFPWEQEMDVEAFLSFAQSLHAAFPDFHFTLEDEAVSGDRIWGRYTARATMRGPFLGQEPTGKTAIWNEMHEVRIDSTTGLIVEHWGAGADESMRIQLGLRSLEP